MSNLTLSDNIPDLEIDYWKQRLKGIKPLNLFTDYSRPDVKNNSKSNIEFSIDKKTISQLKQFSENEKVSLFVTLLSACKVLLYRYSSQEDICVGNAFLKPCGDKDANHIVNALALRTEISSDENFVELLQRVNATITDAYKHQDVPFEKLADVLADDLDLNLNPLYQVMFVLQNEPELRNGLLERYTAKADLTFILKENESGVHGVVEYSTVLYHKETILRIVDHYKLLLTSIIANPKKNIALLPILTRAEENKLLNELNNTAFEYPRDKSLIDLFEEQVDKTPDNVAVIFEDTQLTYRELNNVTNQFGDYLRKTYQVKTDELVGLKLERSEWMVIAMIGILKAGGAYVPIDPEYPQERIDYIMGDSACKVLIDGVEIKKFKEVQSNYNSRNYQSGLQSDHLVYCIYTSGSTGNPKGVLVEHRNVVNLILSQQQVYNITPDERVLQFTTITFDPSAEQFWIAFLTGAALVVPGKDTLSDIKILENYIIDKKVTHIHTVPAFLAELSIPDMNNVKRVITGGESCPPSLAERWKSNGMFINEYGPTETTITSIEYKAENTDNYHVFVPVGRPVANTQIYILDDHQHLLPFGALGEIFIGGDGVSRGYLNRPELTKEKFIENPYKPGELIYRTGDLGRWLADGNIEYTGRIDDQVKIRGYRIELDEIIVVLQKHPKVNAAVVIARPIVGLDKELIAYTTGDAQTAELREYLKEHLPSYMVPGHYVQLESIPLTNNGKVDKKVLPPPENAIINENNYVAPLTDTESILVRIWSKVLDLPEASISITSDFFDMGGHSIKAMKLRGLIHKELNTNLPLKELFLKSTIEQQAGLITGKEPGTNRIKKNITKQPDFALSVAQRRLWIFNQFENAQNGYNILHTILLEGKLNKTALEKSFKEIISRHEILRTVFKEDEESNPHQQIVDAKDFHFKLQETDLQENADKQFALNKLIEKETIGVFNLSTGPLLRCHLVQLEQDKYVLVMLHHNIISDERSMGVFSKELSATYNAYAAGKYPQLPALKIQYKDYAAWHNQQMGSDDILPHKNYWIKQFEGEVPVLELASDKKRPDLQIFNGSSLVTILDKEILTRLNKINKALDGTLFMGLLACVNALLYRYTGQEDIVIGNTTAGREHPDLHDQIGFYTNTLALRTRFNGVGSYEDLLGQVKEVVLGAYEHQLYPYDELVDILKLPKNINRNPVFDVMVTLQDALNQATEFNLNELQVSDYKAIDQKAIRVDLDFKFSVSDQGLNLTLDYNADIYSIEQMQRMLRHFENIVVSVVQDTKQSLNHIDFLTREDKQLLLYEYNDTVVDYSRHKTIVELFEEQVSKTPGNRAVIFKETELSYQEVNIISNQFADYLRKSYQVKPNDLIGINLERSEWAVVAILGILKAGGAYFSIPSDLSQESINNLVKDSNCMLVADEEELGKFKRSQNRYSQENQPTSLQPGNIACCIYNTDSTGDQKACLLHHSGLVNGLKWMQKTYPLTSNDIILQNTPLSSAASLCELIWWAIEGASVCLLQPGEDQSPEIMIDTIDKHNATVVHFDPSAFNAFLDHIERDRANLVRVKGLKQVFTSGGSLTLKEAQRFNELFPNKSLMNLYGPTEAGINAAYFDCKKENLEDSVPIGKPIDNTQIYILDKFRNLVPPGAVGEICIGGAGLARGYLNNPELTAEKFINNPFVKSERIYCTGILGKWLADGNVDYAGNKVELPVKDINTKILVEAPQTDIEKALVKIWARVLDISEKRIGIKNDFFTLGGHSIKAVRLVGLIHKKLGIRLQLKEIFSETTVEKQAILIISKELKTYEGIEKIKEEADYNLSSAQRRLWILNHFEGAQSAYNLPYVIQLEGQLNKEALIKAFEGMALRHEILRTVFKEDSAGAPRQYIINANNYKFKLKETDLRKVIAGRQSSIAKLVDEESFESFDFINGPLWRCHLIQLDEDKHILIMVHHHVISDGWSMDVFRKEWCAFYNAYSVGKQPNLSPLRIQYKDYAAWHTSQLESDDIIPHKNYWVKQFEGEIPVLELPAEKERPPVKTFNGASITATLDSEVLSSLNRTGKALGGTLFMSLLACVNALFYRYTNQEDIVIGSPTAGREHPDLEEQIGFYINTLALRTRFSGTGSYEDLYQQIKEVTLGAYEHQLYPYDELVDTLKLPRNINRNPLFDVMVVLQNSMEQDAEFTLNQLNTTIYEAGEYKVAKFDINFIFSESKHGLDLFLEYNTDIYSPEQMQRMLKHFENIMACVVRDPKQSLAKLDFLTKEEKHQLLDVFNNTLIDYPKEKTLAGIFEEQVLKTPDAVALYQHEEKMTYAELNVRANQLAWYLVELGVNKGDNVGLLVTRSFNMIIGMFGILKAGGAYVPIDPEYPIDRQEYILQNSAVTKIVTDNDYPLESLASADKFVKLKELDLANYNTSNPALDIDSTQLAYTIYTSGSTGRPKGVMIEHHMAVNLVLWVNTEYNIGVDDRLLFITSMCFDLSVYDIFGMLSAGGSLVIVQQQELMDVPVLKDMMLNYKITFWDSVPTTMDYLVRELEANDTGYLQKTLKVVFMSGDWIPVNLPDRIKKYFPATQVISLGGATEGTVWSNYYPVKKVDIKWASIPYGRPMNNNFFYVLNDQQQLAPIGVAGELYIGGVGVARGYANDKEKTDYAFVKDPFSDKAGGRMYRTGDLGRIMPDLNMEFIGRKDDQVKIRGYRIELGEIESVLRQSELISQAVVLAKADKDRKKRLVGYIVGKENYNRSTVISFLKSKLPDYMVPTLWVELDSIPLTANGKIDKKALPEFNAEEQIKEQYVAPRTEVEKILVEIWEEVLKVNNVGVTHDFFDLGGHSLLAVQIVNKIKKRTGKILPISILFKYSNIESLSDYLNENDTEREDKTLVPIRPSGSKPPVYFIHGVGLNVMNFADLSMYLNKEQPVFGFQALGLSGKFPPISSLSEIAKIYVSEMIEHNPTGPYALAGYSLGGFIATEMRRQLELMNKEVRVLAIIDTFADHTDDFIALFPKKVKRRLGKWLKFTTSFIKSPGKALQERRDIILEDKQYRYDAIKLAKESGDEEYYNLLKSIRDIYMSAFHNSPIVPFDGFVYLFRANSCLHYTQDKQYLGWRNYALKGVKEFEIPGDHRTMLLKPNVEEFASILQDVLDSNLSDKK